MSFTENKLIVDLNSNCHDCSTQKTERQKKSCMVFSKLIWQNFSSMKENCQWSDFCCQWHYLLKLVTWIIRLLHISLWKTVGKSSTDSLISGYPYITVIFISNTWISASVKINWLCTWTLVVRTAAFKITEKKLHGFSQTDTVEFLIDERKLSIIKLRLAYILSHLSAAFNSKKLFNALPQRMASTINNFVT